MNTAVENFKNELPDALQIVGMEEGKVIRNDKNQVIEHFGHPDGVSQPLFFTTDYDKFLQGQNIKKEDNQLAEFGDPRAPLNLVLTHDPLGEGDYSFGSYMVYRKLQTTSII